MELELGAKEVLLIKNWGQQTCDRVKVSSYELLEYPIYGDSRNPESSSKTEYESEAKKTAHAKNTPLRIVFAVDKGDSKSKPILCGVITHETVDGEGHGSGSFAKCT
jgi:hypothetical protein